MKILVIGSGGREHALVWKLRMSPQVAKIWCAPGNGGISREAECVAANLNDVGGLMNLAAGLRPDLTVIGPELPLVLGLADQLRAAGIAVVGPGAAGAQLEGSKVYAKRFMQRHGIPTARMYGVFEQSSDAFRALADVAWPVVIKADGLCAGKGVLVAANPEEARAFIDRSLDDGGLGDGGRRVILEEALSGQELSYIVLTDGETVVPFVPTRDHKRVFDGDRGPNTGGMGAFSADWLLPSGLENQIQTNVVQPTIQGLKSDGISYRGFLYFGLMLTADGPKVLEYNCRLGDPETQAILLRADFDLAKALLCTAEGRLDSVRPAWKAGSSICVVLSAKGYPEHPETGAKISGIRWTAEGDETVLFHAGTRAEGSNYYVSGGRVLGVAAQRLTLEAARRLVYYRISSISFDGIHFRRDIGGTELAESQAVSNRFSD